MNPVQPPSGRSSEAFERTSMQGGIHYNKDTRTLSSSKGTETKHMQETKHNTSTFVLRFTQSSNFQGAVFNSSSFLQRVAPDKLAKGVRINTSTKGVDLSSSTKTLKSVLASARMAERSIHPR